MTSDHNIDLSPCAIPPIRPGEVFFAFSRATRPDPKHKFHVLVQIEPRPLFFFINSEIHPYVQADDALLRQQVRLPVRTHGFLRYDSYLDCHETIGGFSASELEDGLTDGSVTRVGVIDHVQHSEARIVIEESETLTRREINSILDQWK